MVNPLTWTATYSYVNEKTHSGCLDPYGRLVANAVGTCCSRCVSTWSLRVVRSIILAEGSRQRDLRVIRTHAWS